MSRLVDVDDLKKAIEEEYNATGDGIVKFGMEKVYRIVENAPTVEPPSDSCIKVTFSEDQLNEIVVRVTEKVMTERLLRDV